MKIRAQNTHDVSVLPVLLLAGSKGGVLMQIRTVLLQDTSADPSKWNDGRARPESKRRLCWVSLSSIGLLLPHLFLLQASFCQDACRRGSPSFAIAKPPTSLEPCPNCLHRTAEGTSWCVLGGEQGQGGQPGRSVEQLNAGPGYYATHASGSPPVQVKPSIELIHRPIGPSIHTSRNFTIPFTVHIVLSQLSAIYQ